VYLRSGRDVLLVHHKRFDEWVPIGGGREDDETPAETAVRELVEETGIINASFVQPYEFQVPGQPRGYLGYSEHTLNGVVNLNHNFLMLTPTKQTKLSDEHHQAGWFRIEQMPDDVYNKMPVNVRYYFRKAVTAVL